MSDKSYRKAENKIINEMSNKRKAKPIVLPKANKPIVAKPNTQVEFY